MNISAMEVVFFKTQKFRSEDPIRLFFLPLVGVSFGKLYAVWGLKFLIATLFRSLCDFFPFISIWALFLTRLHINNHLWRIYSGFVPDAPDTARAIAMPARLTAATKR